MSGSDPTLQLAAMEAAITRIADRDDVAEVRYQHLTETMDRLTESNIQMSNNIGEMVKIQLSTRHDLKRELELQSVKNAQFSESIEDTAKRVRDLELYNATNHGERREVDKRKMWWSANWWLIVSLFLLSIPLIDFLYERVTGKYDEPKSHYERGKDYYTDDTKH